MRKVDYCTPINPPFDGSNAVIAIINNENITEKTTKLNNSLSFLILPSPWSTLWRDKLLLIC